MGNEFEMSMMGELNFFLGLQIKQSPNGTMIHQQKYANELIKKFKMEESKEIVTPIATATKFCFLVAYDTRHEPRSLPYLRCSSYPQGNLHSQRQHILLG